MLAWDKLRRSTARYYASYQEALKNPNSIQQAYLKRLLRKNQHTAFGKRYRFDKINNVCDYRAHIGLNQYDDLKPYIERIIQGEEKVLFDEDVLWFERTSGTTSPSKTIPYCASALDDFRSALFTWVHDLILHYPEIVDGHMYWSISPAARAVETTELGIPIGSLDDSLYFGKTAAQSIGQILSVPAWVSQIFSLDAWHYATLYYLLRDEKLTLISIWSPTFLLELLAKLPNYIDQILYDISRGEISYKALMPYREYMELSPDRHRAEIIKSAINADGIDTSLLWPSLKLISCWASASSFAYAQKLQSYFPTVKIQAKGLLATEGIMTIPQFGAPGPVMTLNSGFYEFLDSEGRTFLAEELREGDNYSIALTNHCGLYRYVIGDRVVVTGKHGNTPCLEFIGRDGIATDVCGEKLTDAFVAPILAEIGGFAMLVPYEEGGKPYYVLYVDAAEVSEYQAAEIAKKIEEALSFNPQYCYARKLEQLSALKVVRTLAPYSTYYKRLLYQGMSLGDIKPTGLSGDKGWHKKFERVLISA